MKRPSQRDSRLKVDMELLAVGDEAGHLYVYAVEYPPEDERNLYDWHGCLTVLVRLEAHSQQICGIAWSLDARFLATGGNDNSVFIFETKRIIPTNTRLPSSNVACTIANPRIPARTTLRPQPLPTPATQTSTQTSYPTLPATSARHHIPLSAAIKALSFAPWHSTLLALGAGSNDRGIHFHHAFSGAKLAAIDCAAQVTSLTWSTTRREIAATFGFAQPEHSVRVAVYSWPDCVLRGKVEWPGEERALWGVGYWGGNMGSGREGREDKGRMRKGKGKGAAGEEKGKPVRRGGRGTRREREGCLVIATSDASIKFHEVWSEGPGGARVAESCEGLGLGQGGIGCLGSEVLEELEGCEMRSGEVIR
ncbi:hypothetical protein CAC42_4927 [Sphaceloma murrayae]|uniref:Uncharacterized protein n=1 Tax=Sphaceloma murrayae TaxID=2082308 RepID=A0A2K1QQ18_9PEZI|nr:hypothetical protein CAC42_4927 [Sphaceloma murrayae]